MDHVYYFPDLDELRVVEKDCQCGNCPHETITIFTPSEDAYFSGVYIGDL